MALLFDYPPPEKEYILIDDEVLVHKLWHLYAKRQNIGVNSFYSIEEFFASDISIFPLKTPLYLDFNFRDKDGQDPLVLALDNVSRLKTHGFEHIRLFSGQFKFDQEVQKKLYEENISFYTEKRPPY